MVKRKNLIKIVGAVLLAVLMCGTIVFAACGGSDPYEEDVDTASSYNDREKAGYALNMEMEEDGAVLMQNKNNALPLETGVTADLFGYMSYNIIHGGGGSGKGNWDDTCMQEKEAFEIAGLDVNDTLWAWHGSSKGAGLVHESWVGSNTIYAGNSYNLYEVPVSTYKKAAKYCDPDNDVAIVTFGRQGSEGAELPMSMNDYYIDTDYRKGSADRTYLDPTEAELELLDWLKNTMGYKTIIVLIDSSNVMTLDEYMQYSDACLWIGGPGENGLVGVGEVLMGKTVDGEQISPNGRTADTWMSDFYSNVVFYNNGGGTHYTNLQGTDTTAYNQYEESIFMGYRWYETAYADGLVLEGARVGDDGAYVKYDYKNDYNDIVTVPFGGGLSYTTFSWEVASSDVKLTAHGTNSISVKVTNTGSRAGKDTVEIYMHAPYTSGGIDKAEVSLVGFAKTKNLEPNESETVTIEFETDELASYDYKGYIADYNGTGVDNQGNQKFGGFVLEAGDYEFRVQSDSHTQKTDPVKATLSSNIIYNDDTNSTGTGIGARESDASVAYNKLNDVNAGDGSGMIYMTRKTMASDWDKITNLKDGKRYREDQLETQASLGTALASAANCEAGETVTVTLAAPYKDTTVNYSKTYALAGSTDSVYITGVGYNATTAKNYWGKTDSEYQSLVANVGTSTTAYTAATRWTKTDGEITENDSTTTSTGTGTYGWDEVPWGDSRWDNWVDQGSWVDMVNLQGSSYDSAYDAWGIDAISAADGPGEAGTGNKEHNTWWCSEVVMASTWNPELIERVGVEYGKQCVASDITSCFGPAMDTHRSPFGGRNFEYYSEDGFLAGMMCLAETAGIQSVGVGTFNKHFMLNDLDGSRMGQNDFCNEQALREIYIRAWEYSMKSKDAPMSGMMTSLNRIGISFGHSGLYVGIVRDEYDWHGLAISDGMWNIDDYSGAVKACFSETACLLYQGNVTTDGASDGQIFKDGNCGGETNASQGGGFPGGGFPGGDFPGPDVADTNKSVYLADDGTGEETEEVEIMSYYGAYQLRETAKTRLYYDTHIYRLNTVFTESSSSAYTTQISKIDSSGDAEPTALVAYVPEDVIDLNLFVKYRNV